MKASRWFRTAVRRLRPSRRLAEGLIARADRARDSSRFADAAPLYEEALRILPRHGSIRVQAGHMRKEVGDFEAALVHYRIAEGLMPNDADLALQLGHYFKRIGNPAEAIAAYQKALQLDPDMRDAAREIEGLGPDVPPAARGLTDNAKRAWSRALEAGLVAELLPEVAVPAETPRERIVLARAGGRPEAGPWGELPTIHGIGAVRGYLVSGESYDTVTITLDGVPIRSGQPIRRELLDGDVDHVFNIWFDTAGRGPGPSMLGVSFGKEGLSGPSIDVPVVIADVLDRQPDADQRDDVILAGEHPEDLEGWIRARPSAVRPALSSVHRTPRSILVLRVDQLGDLVVSVPALRRLRELAPGAKLVGLVTASNVDLARSLGLFDEVLTTPFPLSSVSRERVMSADDQAALRTRLHEYRFDAAIDLGTSHMSRPLLLLSGARDLYGLDTGLWAWIDARLSGGGAIGRSDARILPHSERLMRIVERFGNAVGAIAHRTTLPRMQDDGARLSGLGLAPRGYVVLHESVIHPHNRWTGFAELARLLLATTALDIAFLTDALDRAAELALLPGRERIRLFANRLAFDDLDALLANAAAFAGIDSGPKHLSSLRGVPVVSIHSSRSDWQEWGQEHTGLIVSRRLPCAGCGIGHNDTACGQDFACISGIRPEEIRACILSLLAGDDAEDAKRAVSC